MCFCVWVCNYDISYDRNTNKYACHGKYELKQNKYCYSVSCCCNVFTFSYNGLSNKKIWCHAKTSEALSALDKIKAHFFWHQEDDYTITSKGYIWTYPGKKLFSKSICVLPEKANYKEINCLGICSDFIERYK